jgi:O-antigen ligase
MIGTLALLGGRVKRGLGVAIVVASILAVPLLPSSFWARMASITQPSEDDTGSREARRRVMGEAWQVFVERPLTGVGAGQFKNFNPPWRQERWREAHNVWLQVASETGIFGLIAFAFLVLRGLTVAFGDALSASGPASPRPFRNARLRPAAWPPRARPGPAANGAETHPRTVATPFLATAAAASLAGWFACALFASVAYNWTFYYVLGIAVLGSQLSGRTRLATNGREQNRAAVPRGLGGRPASAGRETVALEKRRLARAGGGHR